MFIQGVGFRLLTKAVNTGFVNLSKLVPFIDGVVGGIFDSVTTNVVKNDA